MRKTTKSISIVLATLLTASLCSCGVAQSSAYSVQTESNSTSLQAASSVVESVSSSSAANSASMITGASSLVSEVATTVFKQQLLEMSNAFFPGTAGCSLEGAFYSADIVDICNEYAFTDDEIKSYTKDFYDSLSDEKRTTFSSQLSALYNFSGSICGYNAKDLLETSGYNSEKTYSSDDVQRIFSDICDACGVVPEKL